MIKLFEVPVRDKVHVRILHQDGVWLQWDLVGTLARDSDRC